MQFKHASLLLLVVLLGTAVLTFIVLERQREIDEQRAAVIQDIGEEIDVPTATKTPAQRLTLSDLTGNQYLSYSLDMNGDGPMESVAIAITGNSVEGTKTEITVNSTTEIFPGTNPEGFFGVVDTNIGDHEKEIAVSDLGPSGDPTTGFYRFDGTRLQLLGIVQGAYEDITFSGNGTIATKTRSHILQTWFYTDIFTLGIDHKLTRVNQPVYLIDPTAAEADFTMLQDLPLHTDASSKTATSIVTTLKKGEAVTLIGCDDVAWCKVQSVAGITGWFLVEDFNTIVKIDGTKVPAGEVFEGLSNAD